MSGIYLAFTTNQQDDKRHDLFNTLLKANFQVYPSNLEYDVPVSWIFILQTFSIIS